MSSAGDSVTQFRRGALEMAILALLWGRELYGVEILEELGRRPGLETSAGTVYPLLGRLKKAGAVDTTWRESPVGPPRKYYRLSATGAEELSAMSAAWRGLSGAIGDLLAEVRDRA